MDAGASQHMTPNREWFATYEPSDRGVLLRRRSNRSFIF
jgi:hypothetical protein